MRLKTVMVHTLFQEVHRVHLTVENIISLTIYSLLAGLHSLTETDCSLTTVLLVV